jgi:hypothetical protein
MFQQLLLLKEEILQIYNKNYKKIIKLIDKHSFNNKPLKLNLQPCRQLKHNYVNLNVNGIIKEQICLSKNMVKPLKN